MPPLDRLEPSTNLGQSDARALAIRGALLASDSRPAADRDAVLRVVKSLGSLQIDPTRAVERTHLLVLWSRLGPYDPAVLDELLWGTERQLFEYAAFIVPIERYPEYAYVMGSFATREGPWQHRVREWLAANEAFRRSIIERIAAEGPLPSRAFDDELSATPWRSSGWTSGRNVSQMLEFMSQRGELLVAGRNGGQRLWDLAERVLPGWTPREAIDGTEFARLRIVTLTRRLGYATEGELRARLALVPREEVSGALRDLVEARELEPVGIRFDDGTTVEAFTVAGTSAPETIDRARTTLLSPFDPLIKDRDRTERLFGFHYRLEMYVPRHLRKFGYFVLPILHDERLIGRIDPIMDRKASRLTIRAVHLEPGVTADTRTGRAVADSVRELADFLGAGEVQVQSVPDAWRSSGWSPMSLAKKADLAAR